jgi:DNA processing protein
MTLQTAVAASVLPASRARVATLFKVHRHHGDASLNLVIDACGLPDSAADAAFAMAAALLAAGRGTHVQPIPWFDAAYPALLDCIPDPPPVLWVRGNPAVLTRPTVAIVGSRAATDYARQVARRLGAELAAHGIVVASGLARGADSAAHTGALDGGGVTVAVQGCGPDRVYPAEHAALARAISVEGAIVSELGPGAAPLPEHFPLRNRIISGLSLAVVVVEASEKSGSLITARYAMEQGRDVMAVPGSVLSGRNRGSHSLLKDGAKIVETAEDILDELGWTPSRSTPATSSFMNTDPVLAQMEEGERYRLDDLIALTGLPGPRLLTRLTELELQGRVIGGAGGLFGRAPGR